MGKKIEPQISEGTLAYLELNGTGPTQELSFEPAPRLNVITGDNGFGKTFLLECAWWALTGLWAQQVAIPRTDAARDAVKLRFQLREKSGAVGTVKNVAYDWEQGKWPDTRENAFSTGLVIYARVDGSFAVWDPIRGRKESPSGKNPLFGTGGLTTGLPLKCSG